MLSVYWPGTFSAEWFLLLSNVVVLYIFREACKYIQEHLTIKTDDLGRDCIVNAAKTSMSSKLIGADSEFFSNLVVDAADLIKVSTSAATCVV